MASTNEQTPPDRPPVNAILSAWRTASGTERRMAVRSAMPDLAEALDRLAAMKVPCDVVEEEG